MPEAQIIALADAIVAELNAHAFSQSFTAERGYLPTFDLPDMGTLRVTVVPKEDEGGLDTRSSSAHEYAIDIGIQKEARENRQRQLGPADVVGTGNRRLLHVRQTTGQNHTDLAKSSRPIPAGASAEAASIYQRYHVDVSWLERTRIAETYYGT